MQRCSSRCRQQRQELSPADGPGARRPRPRRGNGRLGDNLRSMQPDLPWTGRQQLRGDEPLGLGDATGRSPTSPTSMRSSDALGRDYPARQLRGRRRGRGTPARTSGGRRPAPSAAGRARTRAAGLPHPAPWRAVEAHGQGHPAHQPTARRRVFARRSEGGSRGDHDVRDAGSGGLRHDARVALRRRAAMRSTWCGP